MLGSELEEERHSPVELSGPGTRRHAVGGRASLALFVLIAALMATDVAIEYHGGVSLGLESFELVIFALALGGIAFHWWQMMAERRRSEQLDAELAQAQAEVRRWSEDAKRWNREAQGLL